MPRPGRRSRTRFVDKPTCINNVESYANIPLIVREAGWKNISRSHEEAGTKAPWRAKSVTPVS